MSSSLSLEERLSRITKQTQRKVYTVEKRENLILRDAVDIDLELSEEVNEREREGQDSVLSNTHRDRQRREAEHSRLRQLKAAEDSERERLRKLA